MSPPGVKLKNGKTSHKPHELLPGRTLRRTGNSGTKRSMTHVDSIKGAALMSIKSMTGFARSEGQWEDWRWFWEVRSVNGRGLDLRCRLPSGDEALEPQVRQRAAAFLTRGNCQISLHLSRGSAAGAAAQLQINQTVLGQVVGALKQIQNQLGNTTAPHAEAVLGFKGVAELVEAEENESDRQGRYAAILQSLDQALAELIETRASEGARLQAVLQERLAGIERLSEAAAASPARTPEAIGKRLRETIARLGEAAPGLAPERLYQEAVVLAGRADIQEELDRLFAHIAAAQELLEQDGPVGRKLEFLIQEFNREANTLCSKSNDIEITRIGLELKALIDQMREQVQNIE